MTPDLTDTRVLFAALVAVVAALRLSELAISRRNIVRLKKRGAVEHGRKHYTVMVAVHALFLASCVLEVWLMGRPWVPVLAATMGALLLAASALRLWVIAVLGERWSTRVVYVPGDPTVTVGPYRWLKHPNYLAVVVEFAALPMLHTAYLTAVLFGLVNGFVLRRRIQVEEAALRRDTDYRRAFGARPRMIQGGQ
jgi:methyltransferase